MGSTWIRLCPLDDVPLGGCLYLEHGGRPLCIARPDESEAAVFDDACPHAGAPLSGGHIEDGCLVCPMHHWTFRLTDGRCPGAEEVAARRYVTRVREGIIEVLM